MLPRGLDVNFDPDGPGTGGLYGAECPPEDALVHIISVPWQLTASYGRGTRHGPQAILQASQQVDLADVTFGPVYQRGLAWICGEATVGRRNDALEGVAMEVIAAGGASGSAPLDALAEQVSAGGDATNDWVYAHACAAWDAGRVPAVVGGDHSSPYGLIRASAERVPELGVLHIDAHADLRDAYLGFRWSHASIFHNVLRDCASVTRLVGVGWRDMGARELDRIAREPDRIHAWTDQRLAAAQLGGMPFTGIARELVQALPEHVHVSIDIDGLDPALCPRTGTPVPGGLAWREVEHLLDLLSRERRVVSFDLCEVSPGPGGVTEDDAWDAVVGARLLYKLCGAAAVSRVRAEAGAAAGVAGHPG